MSDIVFCCCTYLDYFSVEQFISLTKSSMLPYMFFFMPEARVATHPPTELNSIESGSWPVQ